MYAGMKEIHVDAWQSLLDMTNKKTTEFLSIWKNIKKRILTPSVYIYH
jgi:hypothetical protein